MPDDKVRINADRTAVVDQGYFWRPIDNNTPRGAKLQLIDRRLGVAVYGVYTGTGSWTHWAPLPKFGDSAEARRWIVCWDDEQGACWPMGKDTDCEGALCALHTGKIAMFSSRAAARKAIKVSAAYAKLRKAQGLHANDDFLEGIANVRIVECEGA